MSVVHYGAVACFRSESLRCFAKDRGIRLFRLKIMASVVAAIYANLTTSVAMTYRERKKRFRFS